MNCTTSRILSLALMFLVSACLVEPCFSQAAPDGSGEVVAWTQTFFDVRFGDESYLEQRVHGTELDDTIVFVDGPDGLEVTINGRTVSLQFAHDDSDPTYTGQRIDTILVLGNGGNDTITYNSDILGFGAQYNFQKAEGVVIHGGQGDDTLHVGGNAPVYMYGGPGNDTLSGGETKFNVKSRLFGEEGQDTIYCGPGGHFASGGADDDLIYGGSGEKCSAFGGDGDDEMIGGPGTDQFWGGLGNDIIVGGLGDDHLFGNEGNDEINGGQGNDLIEGNSGADQLLGGVGNDGILGGQQNDLIVGGPGDDSLIGGPGVDTITPGGGNDHVEHGLAELQTLAPTGSGSAYVDFWFENFGPVCDCSLPRPNSGKLVIQGTEARDVCEVFNDANGNVIVRLNGVRYNFCSGNFEISFFGKGADDDFAFHGIADRVNANGGRGDDILNAGGVVNIKVFMNGGPGDDILFVGPIMASATLLGESGDDKFLGANSFKKKVFTGTGNNFVVGSEFVDNIYGDNGKDIIYGRGGADIIISGAGADTIYGGDGNDNIDSGTVQRRYYQFGNGYRDTLLGSDGPDIVYGGNGNDTINSGGGADQLFGGIGRDTIDGGDQSDTITGSGGNDTLIGGGGNDVISGSAGNDTIFGGEGNDTICGDGGVDVLDGGPGTNVVKQ